MPTRGLAASFLRSNSSRRIMGMDSRRAFRAYIACTTAATVAAGVLVAAHEQTRPPLPTLLLLVGLIVYSQHRSVEFTEGSAVNADFMVMMASIVAFHETSPYLGPMIVAAARGFYLPQIRRALLGVGPAQRHDRRPRGPRRGADVQRVQPRRRGRAAECALRGGRHGAGVRRRAVAHAGARPGPAGTALHADDPVVRVALLESLPFSILGFFLGWLYLAADESVVVLMLIVVPMFIAREVFASFMTVKEAHDETVQMLIRALEAKDRYTAGHAERVAEYAQYIGEEMNFGPARMERLRFAALMHDIGKLVVPNHLLNKPGQAHRGGVRSHQDAREGLRADAEPHRLPAADRRRRPQRQHPVRPRRPGPPDRAVHRHDRRRVRRDDLHPLVPQGAAAGGRVQGAPRQGGHPVPPRAVSKR